MSILGIVVITSLAIFFIKCSGYNYPIALLTQDGFDFSAGISDTENPKNNDGVIARWSPGDPHPDYPSQSAYLWFHTAVTPNKTKDMGEVGLSTIRDVSGIAWDTLPPPLLVGHSVVIGCKDGYAKIKVTATSTAIPQYAEVYYYYSENSYFEN
jgi:hypothetical protein